MIAIVIAIGYSATIFILLVIPVAILFWFLQEIYVKTARQLKRLESAARSPICSKLGETVSGIMTVRAFNMQEIFMRDFEERINIKQTCSYLIIVCDAWRSIRLESKLSIIILLELF